MTRTLTLTPNLTPTPQVDVPELPEAPHPSLFPEYHAFMAEQARPQRTSAEP